MPLEVLDMDAGRGNLIQAGNHWEYRAFEDMDEAKEWVRSRGAHKFMVDDLRFS